MMGVSRSGRRKRTSGNWSVSFGFSRLSVSSIIRTNLPSLYQKAEGKDYLTNPFCKRGRRRTVITMKWYGGNSDGQSGAPPLYPTSRKSKKINSKILKEVQYGECARVVPTTPSSDLENAEKRETKCSSSSFLSIPFFRMLYSTYIGLWEMGGLVCSCN